jgi:hypothetical protein
MAVLALWTLHVLLLVPIARLRAGRAGQVTPEDFRLGESGRVPADVSLPNRNFMNLLEVPVLWYVAGFVAHLAGLQHPVFLGLSWAFVALRIAHSLVHLKPGHSVLLRAGVFATGNVVLSVMWWWLLVALVSASR